MSAPAPGAAPLWVQVLLPLFAAPAMACIWRFLAQGWALAEKLEEKGRYRRPRGWVLAVQRGQISARVRRWEHLGFWVVLWVGYAALAFMFGAAWLGFRLLRRVSGATPAV